jgi:hypothetical protein
MKKEEQEEPQKVKETSDAIAAFFGQFGTIDVHTQIVLEEFFEELLKNE